MYVWDAWMIKASMCAWWHEWPPRLQCWV